MLKLAKKSFFHQTKALPDSTYCSASQLWSETAWFHSNSEYFCFKFAKCCISQKITCKHKNAQIGQKQAFLTKQKHCPTQLFVLHHYSEAKSRDFIEIVSILASNSQNAAFYRKNMKTQKCSNWPKTSFFTKQKHCLTQLFVLHH